MTQSAPKLLGLGMLCLTLALGGCGNEGLTDLEQYVASVLDRKGGQVEALPAIKPYERYVYQAADKNARDPFQPALQQENKTQVVVAGTSEQQRKFNDEIMAHNSEELEAFELDSLRMVGTLQSKSALWAIIIDNDGTVHRVQVGNYMGRNFGKVLEIQEDRVELREIVKDADGNWEERNASLALAEQQ